MTYIGYLSLGFLIGVSQLLFLSELNDVWYFVNALFLLPFLSSRFNRNYRTVHFVLGLCCGFSYGLFSAQLAVNHQLKNAPDQSINLIGTVVGLPVDKTDHVKFSFAVTKSEIPLPVKKILITWYKAPEEIRSGQQWQFNLKLKPISGNLNPGSFDYSRWLFSQGYDATATVKSAQLLTSQISSYYSFIDNLRQEIAVNIDEHFNSSRVKSLIRALTIGDKAHISLGDSYLFQKTGTAHLMAISGLHIGLMAFIGVLIGRLFYFFFANEVINKYKFEAVFSISFSFFYALLAGMSTSTVRALIMILVFSLAHVSKKNLNVWQSLAIALIIVLLIDPLSVLGGGLWLSFVAVAVLLFAFDKQPPQKSKIIGFINAQLIILVGLLPITLLFFNHINLLTPVINALVLPFASFLLIPLSFISLALIMISTQLAGPVITLVEWLVSYLLLFLEWIHTIDYFTFETKALNTFSVMALILASFILLLPSFFRWRLFAVIFLVPLFIDRDKRLKPSEFEVNMLDIGQGLSMVIKTSQHVLIYDTGASFDSGFSMATSVVIPYLRHEGIKRIDKMILSHDDNDHSGGAQDLITRFNDVQVLDVKGGQVDCLYPLKWQWDGVDFNVLSPFSLTPYLKNNSSCVLQISSKHGSILLTGDIEEPVEYRLIKQFKDQIKSDVLVVPHHGSRTSSSETFINQVNPSVAINSSGFVNQFNHPHPVVKQRYLKNNVKFYDTQSSGMITVLFHEGKIDILPYTGNNHHFWQLKKTDF